VALAKIKKRFDVLVDNHRFVSAYDGAVVPVGQEFANNLGTIADCIRLILGNAEAKKIAEPTLPF
jgi:hypothetical protein